MRATVVCGSQATACRSRVVGLLPLLEHRSPITDIRVIDDNTPVPDGYRKYATNLNKLGGGASIFFVYKQDYPIRDIQLVKEGVAGYEFIDRNLHVDDAHRLQLAFSHGGRGPPITAIELVPNEGVAAAEARGLVHVSPDELGGQRLMVRRGEGCPITKLDVFRGSHRVRRVALSWGRLPCWRTLTW